MTFLDQYKIPGTVNVDDHLCYRDPDQYPKFQEDMEKFKRLLVDLVDKKRNVSFLKWGDGEYCFLKKIATGSAIPGRRALLTKTYEDIDLTPFKEGVLKNDYILIEIYPEKHYWFHNIFPNRKVDFPAEYVYGLMNNTWLLKTFKGRAGLIGGKEKLELIQELLKFREYRDYLGIDGFVDYIAIPQRGACDDIDETEKNIARQLKKARADIFFYGMGQAKMALAHRLKKHKRAVYLDVGGGIDAIAGSLNATRPYAAGWVNHRIVGFDYSRVAYLNYRDFAKHRLLGLEREPLPGVDNVIMFGPWVGEFGYEFSWWVPEIRKIRWEKFPDHYAVAVGYSGRRAFYKDFIDTYIGFPDEIQASIEYPSAHAVFRDGQHVIPENVMNYFKMVGAEFAKAFRQVKIYLPGAHLYQRSFEEDPFGDFVHLEPDDKVAEKVRRRLKTFKYKRPIVAVNAKIRVRRDRVDGENWNPKHWEEFIKRLITKLKLNVVMMGVPRRGDYPGSLDLPDIPSLRRHADYIHSMVFEGEDSVEYQLALLKNTKCSIYGSTHAAALAFFTNTPVFTYQSKSGSSRLKLEWQKKLTNGHKYVKIVDNYAEGEELYSAPVKEIFAEFKKFYLRLP